MAGIDNIGPHNAGQTDNPYIQYIKYKITIIVYENYRNIRFEVRFALKAQSEWGFYSAKQIKQILFRKVFNGGGGY